MADHTQPTTTGLVIPPEVQEKFAVQLEMIKASESMNNEERQYWINILPIMSAEQLKNLEDILTNEHQQLAAIDAKYSKESAVVGSQAIIDTMEQKLRSKKTKREQVEQEETKEEETKEADLLAQIQSL